jgi:hypothetical protein
MGDDGTIVEKYGGKIRVSTPRGPSDHGTSYELKFAEDSFADMRRPLPSFGSSVVESWCSLP